MLNQSPTQTFRPILLNSLGGLMGLLLLLPTGCRQNTPSAKGRPMRLSVGEIKEVTLSSRLPVVGTSDNQEIVDVSQKPMTPADSSALQQGNPVAMTFLVKGVTIGTVQVTLADKAPDAVAGRVRRAYRVQVVSK